MDQVVAQALTTYKKITRENLEAEVSLTTATHTSY